MSSRGGLRACRVTVKVVAIRDVGSLSNPVVQVLVEDSYFRTSDVKEKAEDGLITFDQGHSFDVKDEKSAEVRVAVAGKTSMGMRKVLGSIKPLRVADLLETDPDRTLEPEWYDIVAKEGKKSSVGKVLLHVVAARAPPQQPIKLFIGSWNVGNAPPPDDLSPWLPKGTDHELIAIGSQECEYQPRSGYATCMEDWVAAIKAHFAPHYKVVKGTTRGQMRLVVLVLETSQKAITDVTSTSEATGIGHVIANKGAVSVSLKFWDTSFCFVNSHLAAHEGHCQTRNDNYREVVRNMHPGLSSIDLLSQFRHVFWMGDLNYRLAFPGSAHAGQGGPMDGDDDSSGDEDSSSNGSGLGSSSRLESLNEEGGTNGSGSKGARVMHRSVSSSGSGGSGGGSRSGSGRKLNEMDRKMVSMGGSAKERKEAEKAVRMALHQSIVEKIDQGDFTELLKNDELQREIREGRAFYKFCEAPIDFAPTFKVLRDELRQYNPKRLPAWCDRVLWRSLPGCDLTCTRYTSAPNILTGDHKPVLAEFDVTTYALPVTMDPSEEAVQLLQLSKGHSDKDDMRWHLHFTDLKGHNLLSADANGLSDPYIRFVGPNLFKSFQTKKCYKTLNPVWGADDVPAIVLEHQSLHYYEKDYLLAAVFDHDKTNKDDPLGFAAIPLADLVKATWEQSSQPVSFRVEVTYKGLPAGELDGSFRLFWAVNKLSEGKCAQM
ncbi:hypothetical protein CLOM_g20265 [Closterium sp. NIES-68]|nr:hypothetical protein CLOM_g20265 [Closterium sp. NIES-68]GJP64354.1 hypothetical protein CLOP_g21360 [Closterium sp. NIES-67]